MTNHYNFQSSTSSSSSNNGPKGILAPLISRFDIDDRFDWEKNNDVLNNGCNAGILLSFSWMND